MRPAASHAVIAAAALAAWCCRNKPTAHVAGVPALPCCRPPAVLADYQPRRQDLGGHCRCTPSFSMPRMPRWISQKALPPHARSADSVPAASLPLPGAT